MRPKPRLGEKVINEAREMLGRCPLCGFVRKLVRPWITKE